MDDNKQDPPSPLPPPIAQQQNIPSIQLQLPVAMPQRPITNTQALVESIKDFTSQGNQAEEKVALQIILISSAVLAIIGGVAVNRGTNSIGIIAALFLIVSVAGLGISLLTGVIHFISERRFWYKNREKAVDALKVIGTMQNPVDKENAALAALSNTQEGSSRAAWIIQLVSFLVGASALIVLVVAAVVSEIK